MQIFAQAFNESEITNYSCWGTFQTFPCNECWLPPPGWRPRWSSSLTRARSPSRTSPRSPPPRSRASWSQCWGSLRQSQTWRGRRTSRRGPKWIRRVQRRKLWRREWRQLRSVHLRKHLACNLINMNGLSSTRQPKKCSQKLRVSKQFLLRIPTESIKIMLNPWVYIEDLNFAS